MSLSDAYFEIASVHAQTFPWPPVRNLDVKEVTNWYFTHRSGLAQVSKPRVERALFCLLHLAKSNSDPTLLIWILHALEEMKGTGNTQGQAQGQRALKERIRLVLNCNQQQIGELNKRFKSLHKARNEFVHGGLDLIHPVHADLLDHAIDETLMKTFDVGNFGFRLLLAVIQETIEKGWLQPEFTTIFTGRPLVSDSKIANM